MPAQSELARVVVLDACLLVCGQEDASFRCDPAMEQNFEPGAFAAHYEWIRATMQVEY